MHPTDELATAIDCSIERHLLKLGSPAAMTIYLVAASNGSGRFNASFNGVADYLGISRSAVIRAIAALRDGGYCVEIERAFNWPVVYQVVAHDEWATAHPDQCVTKTATCDEVLAGRFE
jgi:DNA-binding Lrp family transcriptional regulator